MRPQHDAWTGRDKRLHFQASALIAGATTAVVGNQDVDQKDKFPIAMSITLTFGIGKEAYDVHVGRGWSWKDIVWDIAGALAGYALVEAID